MRDTSQCVILNCGHPCYGQSAWCDVHAIFAGSQHAPAVEDVDPVRYAAVKARVDARQERDRRQRQRDRAKHARRMIARGMGYRLSPEHWQALASGD